MTYKTLKKQILQKKLRRIYEAFTEHMKPTQNTVPEKRIHPSLPGGLLTITRYHEVGKVAG